MHIGSDVHVDRTWGSVIVHRRWGCVDWRSNRSKVEGKLTVGLPKAWWSDYCEGSAVRWARRDRSGTKSAFASQWWIGVWDARWSAFGSLCDRRLDHSLSLSRSRSLHLVRCVLSFCGSLSLLRVWGKCLKVKWFCKMISESNEANFGQTEIIFRKIYFL